MRVVACVGLGIRLVLTAAGVASAQVQVGVPGRATYSERHVALQLGTPRADTVLQVQRVRSPERSWQMDRAAMRGGGDWQVGLIALTRLAELRTKAHAAGGGARVLDQPQAYTKDLRKTVTAILEKLPGGAA